MASCPEGDCECPACLVSMVVRNELIFFRKFSDPNTRRAEEPRYELYKNGKESEKH